MGCCSLIALKCSLLHTIYYRTMPQGPSLGLWSDILINTQHLSTSWRFTLNREATMTVTFLVSNWSLFLWKTYYLFKFSLICVISFHYFLAFIRLMWTCHVHCEAINASLLSGVGIIRITYLLLLTTFLYRFLIGNHAAIICLLQIGLQVECLANSWKQARYFHD